MYEMLTRIFMYHVSEHLFRFKQGVLIQSKVLAI